MHTSAHPVSEAPRTHCTTDRPGCGCCGKRSIPSSNRTASVSAQLSRNAARSPSTAGPVTRKCVSRHSDSSRAFPCHSSAIPTPPVKPTASSTIMTLRWVRWSILLGSNRRSGRNQRTCTPAPSIRSVRERSIGCAPHASKRTRTRTSSRALAASDSANLVPISPCQYTNVRRSIVCSAPSMASSIAGKISSPLRRTSSRFPSVAGTPITPSRVRRIRSVCSRSDATMWSSCTRRQRSATATDCRSGRGSVMMVLSGLRCGAGTPARTASSCAATDTP